MLQKIQIQGNALQKMSEVLTKKLLLFSFLSIFFFQSSGQHQVGITAGYHKLGLIQGIEYEYMHKRWGFPFEMDYHVIRLFQQRKFQFRLIGGLNYAVIKTEKIRLKANIIYGITNLPLTKKQPHYWDEILVGSSVEVGKKWKFVARVYIGLMQQRFRNSTTQKWIRASELGYNVKIGLLYEI